MIYGSARGLRVRRLFHHDPNALLVVPLDHTVTDGPFTDAQRYLRLLQTLAASPVDAIVVHKGRLRFLPAELYARLSVIVHLSASTRFAADVDHKYLVGEVRDCVRAGADAISTHVNLGSRTEAEQLRAMAFVADGCEREGVPLLAMMYGRGEGVCGREAAEVAAHAGSLATDLGADLVKLSLHETAHCMAHVIAQIPIPVLAAGGAPVTGGRLEDFVRQAMACGAHGIAAGRNVFMSEDPRGTAVAIRAAMSGRCLEAGTGSMARAGIAEGGVRA